MPDVLENRLIARVIVGLLILAIVGMIAGLTRCMNDTVDAATSLETAVDEFAVEAERFEQETERLNLEVNKLKATIDHLNKTLER